MYHKKGEIMKKLGMLVALMSLGITSLYAQPMGNQMTQTTVSAATLATATTAIQADGTLQVTIPTPAPTFTQAQISGMLTQAFQQQAQVQSQLNDINARIAIYQDWLSQFPATAITATPPVTTH